MPSQRHLYWHCPECGHSLRWSLHRSTQPRPGEPSVCGHLSCVRDLHGRDDVASDGLAGLVHALACEEKESGGDAGRHTLTHPSGTTITGSEMY
jgi:phage terminase large subunit GpA-like protein